MARKDKPYLPLYIQDFMTDEKLNECSAAATGVYIRIMCVMHKSEPYGTILLKQKYKQTDRQEFKQMDKQIFYFACQLAKNLPYQISVIAEGLQELVNEGCLQIEGDLLKQKRMFEDGILSSKRSLSGSKGGSTTQGKSSHFAKAKVQANIEANSDIETDIAYTKENVLKGGMGESQEGLCFDIEQWLISRPKELEVVCMNSKKSLDEVKECLKKYHLHCQKTEYYPKRPLPLIAGLQLWIMNERKFLKNGSHTEKSSSIGKTIDFD